MEPNDLSQKIQKQIEYYLSDDNLKNDAYFHKIISEDKNGFVSLAIFLNCNKIIRLGANEPDLVKALQNSSILQLSDDKTAVRRKNNKPLPVLRSKKVYITFDKNTEIGKQENVVLFVPFVVAFKTSQDMFFKGKDLERKIRKKLTIELPYVKVAKKFGYMVFNELNIDSDAVNELITAGLKIDKHTLELKKLSEEESKSWLKTNRGQIESSLKQKYQFAVIKDKTDRKVGIDENFGPIFLNGKKFADVKELKNQLKLIICKSKNKEVLKENDFQLVKALLSFHNKGKEKLENLKEIEVDANPKFPATRCFFVVKNDGSKDDFSFHKCLEDLVATQMNK